VCTPDLLFSGHKHRWRVAAPLGMPVGAPGFAAGPLLSVAGDEGGHS